MPTLAPPEPNEAFDAVMDDGAVIRIRRHGNPDGMRVVLSHGNGFAADAYYPFWRELMADCDIVLFDCRNCGQNPFHSADAHHYPRIVEDLGQIRRAIDDEFGARPVMGLFHSLTARANMKRALAEGWLWEAMVLFDPPMVPPPGHWLHARTDREMRVLAHWSRHRPERFDDPSDLARQFAETRGFAGWVEGAHACAAQALLRRDGGAWVLACPGELEARIYEGNAALDIWPGAEEFERPVLIIASDPEYHGAQSPAASCLALSDECGFPYISIPGTGHFLELEAPERCAREIRAFAAEIGMIDRANTGSET